MRGILIKNKKLQKPPWIVTSLTIIFVVHANMCYNNRKLHKETSASQYLFIASIFQRRIGDGFFIK